MVCDASWNMNDVQVVCRQLECGLVILAPGNAQVGEGSGSIFLDNVECRENESSLWQCSHGRWSSHNCGHQEDAKPV